MLTSWTLVKFFYYVCGIGGIIANSLLLIIVIFCHGQQIGPYVKCPVSLGFNSNRSIGSYRFLIACFVGASLYASISNTILMPMMSVNRDGWMLFAVGVHEEQKAGSYFLIMFCTSVVILLMSLMYSYLDRLAMAYNVALFGDKLRRSLLILVFIVIIVIWILQTVFFLLPTDEMNKTNEEYLKRIYNLDINQLSYIAVESYVDDKLSFHFVIVFVVRLIIVNLSFGTIVVCAFLTHRRLRSDMLRMQFSVRVAQLQRRLFRVLLIQTAVPVCFTYIPVLTSLLLTFLRLDLPELCEITSLMLPIAQFLDPIVIFMFVSDYRKAAKAALNSISTFSKASSEPTISTK